MDMVRKLIEIIPDVLMPTFFLLITIMLRRLARIRFVSGTDAIALLSVIDSAVAWKKLDIAKIVQINLSAPELADLFLALTFVGVGLLIWSVDLERRLELVLAQPLPRPLQHPLRLAARRSRAYLMAYVPATLFAVGHWQLVRSVT